MSSRPSYITMKSFRNDTFNVAYHHLIPRSSCFPLRSGLGTLCLAALIRCWTGSHRAWWVPVGLRLLKDKGSIGSGERKGMQAILLWRTRRQPVMQPVRLHLWRGWSWFRLLDLSVSLSYRAFVLLLFFTKSFSVVWKIGFLEPSQSCVVPSLVLGLQLNPFFCQFGTEDWNIMRWCRQASARKDGQLGD